MRRRTRISQLLRRLDELEVDYCQHGGVVLFPGDQRYEDPTAEFPRCDQCHRSKFVYHVVWDPDWRTGD